MSESKYRKHFIPLESNPEVFTWLVHKLGVSETLSFVDIWALDSTEHVPRPAVALVLVFPTSADYEQRRSAEDSGLQEHIAIRKDGDGIIWLPQTINNACGLYAIFHAVCNSDARRSIRPRSLLANFLTAFQTQHLQACIQMLEDSAELEAIYNEAAKQGDSAVPTDAEEEVDFHYVCLVKADNGRVYEMDGDRKGAIDTGVQLGDEQDVLSRGGLGLVRECIDREGGGSVGFSLMALVQMRG